MLSLHVSDEDFSLSEDAITVLTRPAGTRRGRGRRDGVFVAVGSVSGFLHRRRRLPDAFVQAVQGTRVFAVGVGGHGVDGLAAERKINAEVRGTVDGLKCPVCRL